MKDLNNYILENTNKLYENELLERLCNHISIIVYTKYGSGIIPNIQLKESLGNFKNAHKVLNHIITELKSNFNSQEINCDNYDVFFKKIKIDIINKDLINASYLNIDNDVLEIEILCLDKETFIDYIYYYIELILHEMLHGYEDYCRKSSNTKGIFDLWNINYKKSYININNINDIKRYLSRCKYFFNSQERNAYFSSLELCIKDIIKKYHISADNLDYEKFKRAIKDHHIWKIYFDLGTFIIGLENINNDNKKYIEKQYNSLFESNKSFNEIKKELNISWKKFDKKFNQLVPKILCNNIQIKEFKNYSFNIDKLI